MAATRCIGWITGCLLAASAAWGQAPLPKPAGAPAAPALQQALEAQRPGMDAYYQCLRDNEKAYKRHSVAQQLISLRDNRPAIEAALAKNPQLKNDIKYKNVDEAIAEGLAMYRAAGGTAKTVADVKPAENPCSAPVKAPPARSGGEQASAVSAIAAKTVSGPLPADKAPEKVPAVKPAQTPKPVAAEPAARRRGDPRECLTLSTDKAVMACAEKYR